MSKPPGSRTTGPVAIPRTWPSRVRGGLLAERADRLNRLPHASSAASPPPTRRRESPIEFGQRVLQQEVHDVHMLDAVATAGDGIHADHGLGVVVRD